MHWRQPHSFVQQLLCPLPPAYHLPRLWTSSFMTCPLPPGWACISLNPRKEVLLCHSPFNLAIEDNLLCYHRNSKCPQLISSMSGMSISSHKRGFSCHQNQVWLCARPAHHQRLRGCTGNSPALFCSVAGCGWPVKLHLLTCGHDPSIVGLMNVTSFFPSLGGWQQGLRARLNMLGPLWVNTKDLCWKPRDVFGNLFLPRVGPCGFLTASATVTDQHYFCSP